VTGLERHVAAAALGLVERLPALGGQKVLVVVPDRTRDFAAEWTLHPMLEALLESGASPGNVTVAIASGSHVTSDHDVERVGELPTGIHLLRHIPEDATAFVGATSRGTEVRVHPALLEADLVCAIGPVALHYFAGFGGGGKLLFPGLGSRASIAANHRLSLAPQRGLADGVAPGRTSDNPVALDLREAHELLPRAHHLSLLHGGRALAWSDFDEFDRLTSAYALECRAGEAHSADLVTTVTWSATDVVQAHKTLFHAALFARDGGEIWLYAECPEGVGSPTLARWLELPDRAALEAAARTHYDLNAQTAISLVAIAERVRVRWFSSTPLPALERWGIECVDVPISSDARAAEIRHSGGTELFLEHATRTIPRLTPANER